MDSIIQELNQRSKDIFLHIIDEYFRHGLPVSSKLIVERKGVSLSSASVRNVMAHLEEMGLLYSPHTSAGRLPTHAGLRFFVDGLLEFGNLKPSDKQQLQEHIKTSGATVTDILDDVAKSLSKLSNCTTLVYAPKVQAKIKHIEFLKLSPGRVLVILVNADGLVENRLLEFDFDIALSTLTELSNYINHYAVNKSLPEMIEAVVKQISKTRRELNKEAQFIVEKGLAQWGQGKENEDGYLIINGQSNLLDDIHAIEQLEKVRSIMQGLETHKMIANLLKETESAKGVKIFIGSENEMFGHADLSMVMAPYESSESKLVGAIAVLGPVRMNYAKIIPMVDYTSKIISRYLYNKD